MADEPLTIRGVNWRETFPFTNLFRAFRIAIHPSKLVLALVALILLFVGGQLLDLVWPVQGRAVPGEVAMYDQFSGHAMPGEKFVDGRSAVREKIESVYAQDLLRYKIEPNADAAARAAHDAADLGQLKSRIQAIRDQAVASAKSARDTAVANADKTKSPATDELRRTGDETYKSAVREAYAAATAEYRRDTRIKNQGLFDAFFEYESNQVSNVIHGIRGWNWFGEDQAMPIAAGDGVLDLRASIEALSSGGSTAGVVQSMLRFSTVGPIWLLTQHPIYFLAFGILFLALWSVFGGAISRIAAVHVARDEKLSIRSALVFSGGKFLSFLFAPIIPLLIVTAVGLLVSLGALLGNVPYFGPILVGLVFVVVLAAGFVMALVLLGLVGGFNLMYPTIAVEGSDSFDAISRSFSYLYARPWRLGFYTLVSLIYGAITYLFVRLFIYLMLVLAHRAVGAGIFTSADSTAPLWTSLWPSPSTAGRLTYDIDSLGLTFSQEIGARLIWLWVHGVIAILGAFAISFYFSSNTIIYYLMRREVDATDLDDVYLDQLDDEFADPATPPPAPGSTDAIVSAAGEVTPPTP